MIVDVRRTAIGIEADHVLGCETGVQLLLIVGNLAITLLSQGEQGHLVGHSLNESTRSGIARHVAVLIVRHAGGRLGTHCISADRAAGELHMVAVGAGRHIFKCVGAVISGDNIVGIAKLILSDLRATLVELHGETGQTLFACILLAVVVGVDPGLTFDYTVCNMGRNRAGDHGLAKLVGVEACGIAQAVAGHGVVQLEVNIQVGGLVLTHMACAHNGNSVLIDRILHMGVIHIRAGGLLPGDTQSVEAIAAGGHTLEVSHRRQRVLLLNGGIRGIIQIHSRAGGSVGIGDAELQSLIHGDGALLEHRAASVVVKRQNIQQQRAGQVMIHGRKNHTVMRLAVAADGIVGRQLAEACYIGLGDDEIDSFGHNTFFKQDLAAFRCNIDLNNVIDDADRHILIRVKGIAQLVGGGNLVSAGSGHLKGIDIARITFPDNRVGVIHLFDGDGGNAAGKNAGLSFRCAGGIGGV